MRHQGKVAIVIGGGRDIGRACALRLAREGANQAVEEITRSGGQAIAVQADLTRSEDVQELVAEHKKRLAPTSIGSSVSPTA